MVFNVSYNDEGMAVGLVHNGKEYSFRRPLNQVEINDLIRSLMNVGTMIATAPSTLTLGHDLTQSLTPVIAALNQPRRRRIHWAKAKPPAPSPTPARNRAGRHQKGCGRLVPCPTGLHTPALAPPVPAPPVNLGSRFPGMKMDNKIRARLPTYRARVDDRVLALVMASMNRRKKFIIGQIVDDVFKQAREIDPRVNDKEMMKGQIYWWCNTALKQRNFVRKEPASKGRRERTYVIIKPISHVDNFRFSHQGKKVGI